MLDRDGWRDCAEMMDMRIWVECDREICRARTIERNLAAGIVASREACEVRGQSYREVSDIDYELIYSRQERCRQRGRGCGASVQTYCGTAPVGQPESGWRA